MTRWFPAAAIATFVLGAQAAYAQAPAEGHPLQPQRVPGRQHRGPGSRRQQQPRCRRDGFGRRPNDGRCHDGSRRPVHAARASVRSLYSQRALARLLQVARAHGSADHLEGLDSRNPASTRRAPGKRPSSTAEPVADADCSAGDAARRIRPRRVAAGSRSCRRRGARPSQATPADDDGEQGETAWRLRHLPRSILKDVDDRRRVGGGAKSRRRDGSAVIRPPRLCRSRSSAIFRCRDSST